MNSNRAAGGRRRRPDVTEVIAPDTRDRVRGDNASASSSTDRSDYSSAEAPADGTSVTAGGRNRWVRWLMARLQPPDICHDRPGLAKLSAYARYGAGAPADAPDLRTAQIWWFRLVCLPITAWTYWKAWALERPFRGTPFLIAQVGWWLLNIATLLRIL